MNFQSLSAFVFVHLRTMCTLGRCCVEKKRPLQQTSVNKDCVQLLYISPISISLLSLSIWSSVSSTVDIISMNKVD